MATNPTTMGTITKKKTNVYEDYIAANPEFAGVIKGTAAMPETATAEDRAVATAYQSAYSRQKEIDKNADNAIFDANKAHDLAQKYLAVQNKASGLGGLGVSDTSSLRLSSQYQKALSDTNATRETATQDNYSLLQDRVDTIHGEWDNRRYNAAQSNIYNFYDWGSASNYLVSLGYEKGSQTYNEFKAQWQGMKSSEIAASVLNLQDQDAVVKYLQSQGITAEENAEVFNSIMSEWEMEYLDPIQNEVGKIQVNSNFKFNNEGSKLKAEKIGDNFSIVDSNDNKYRVQNGGVDENVTAIIRKLCTVSPDNASSFADGSVFMYNGQAYLIFGNDYTAYRISVRDNSYATHLNDLQTAIEYGATTTTPSLPARLTTYTPDAGSGGTTVTPNTPADGKVEGSQSGFTKNEDGTWLYNGMSCGNIKSDNPPNVVWEDGVVRGVRYEDGTYHLFSKENGTVADGSDTTTTPDAESGVDAPGGSDSSDNKTPDKQPSVKMNQLFSFNWKGGRDANGWLRTEEGKNFSIVGPNNKKYRVEIGAANDDATKAAAAGNVYSHGVFEYKGELYIYDGSDAYAIKNRPWWGNDGYTELKEAWGQYRKGDTSSAKKAHTIGVSFNNNGGFRTNFKDGDNFSVKMDGKVYRVESGGEVTDWNILAAADDITDGQVFEYGDADETGDVKGKTGNLYLKKNGRVYRVDQRDMGAPTQRKQYTALYERAYGGDMTEEEKDTAAGKGIKLLEGVEFNRNGGWIFFGASDFRSGDNFSAKVNDEKVRIQSNGEVSSDDPVIDAAATVDNYRMFGYNQKTYIKVNGKVYLVEVRDAKSNRHVDFYEKLYNQTFGDGASDGSSEKEPVILNKNNSFLFFGAKDFRDGDNFSVKVKEPDGTTKIYRVESGGEVTANSTVAKKAESVPNKTFFKFESTVYYKEYGRIYKVDVRGAGQNADLVEQYKNVVESGVKEIK